MTGSILTKDQILQLAYDANLSAEAVEAIEFTSEICEDYEDFIETLSNYWTDGNTKDAKRGRKLIKQLENYYE